MFLNNYLKNKHVYYKYKIEINLSRRLKYFIILR